MAASACFSGMVRGRRPPAAASPAATAPDDTITTSRPAARLVVTKAATAPR